MKNDPDPKRLLGEVLDDTEDFRAGMLEVTLGAVRRKRRARLWGRGTAAAALVLGIGFLVLRPPTPRMLTHQPPQSPPITRILASQPLAPEKLIATRPAAVQLLIVSTPIASVPAIETRAAQRDYQLLDDDQLLALAAGSPIVLVRQGPNQAELLFANALSETVPTDDDLNH